MKRKNTIISCICLLFFLIGCNSEIKQNVQTKAEETAQTPMTETEESDMGSDEISNYPEYQENIYTELNNNIPEIPESDYTTKTFIDLSELDSLGRCGVAYACVGPETIAEGERGEIGHVKPSGWHTVKYDFIDGNYCYNRAHLLMWKLTGINDDERNLITGTRYLNVEGMLPFEERIMNYIYETGNHVMYRVTPIFKESELVARGVKMEAASVEESSLRFNIYVYNVQPGVIINYATGDTFSETEIPEVSENTEDTDYNFVLNLNTNKFHKPDCESVRKIKPQNIKYFSGTRDVLMNEGYEPCKACNP